MILEQIHSPTEVKALSEEQLSLLCDELRRFLVQSVSQTGGHLASNLGVVELTVALHRVFDTSRDALVFDVGHQCYVHKALTGRAELFSTLRQLGGLSGFPKPWESEHDAFIAGHASNSVSVALGFARAYRLQGESKRAIALIGDGALTGGLALEGLNDAGASGEPLLVILNDNGMSILPNVGALSQHLAQLRMKPGYHRVKNWYRAKTAKNKARKTVYRITHGVKTSMKRYFWPKSTVFEDMGFTYIGPIDGHDLPQLIHVLCWAKEQQKPIVLHVRTVKGRGYLPAEREPDKFHGVGAFDPTTGAVKKSEGTSFSSMFGRALTELAEKDSRICAVSAAMLSGTGLDEFAKQFPQRTFDVGIAEGHAVAMCAGMAKGGMLPVFCVYSTFLQRGYDMLLHDVALQGLHVVFGIDRAGLVGADGETHHGCFDVQFLAQIPNMTVLCPANYAELRSMLHHALYELSGAVAIRYPRGGEGAYQDCLCDAPLVSLREGEDVTLVSYGPLVNEALTAAEELEKCGIRTEVVKLNCITPLDSEAVVKILGQKKCLLVLEDALQEGCVGQRLATLLQTAQVAPQRLLLHNCGTDFVPQGTVAELRAKLKLDAAGIVSAVQKELPWQK